MKKERKNLRTYIKEFDYFANSEEDKLGAMEKIEQLVETLTLKE